MYVYARVRAYTMSCIIISFLYFLLISFGKIQGKYAETSQKTDRIIRTHTKQSNILQYINTTLTNNSYERGMESKKERIVITYGKNASVVCVCVCDVCETKVLRICGLLGFCGNSLSRTSIFLVSLFDRVSYFLLFYCLLLFPLRIFIWVKCL